MSKDNEPLIRVSGTFLAVAMFVSAIGGVFFERKLARGYDFCESQAPRVNVSTPTNIFNQCTKTLPDGTVVVWDQVGQHKKDLASGAALKLE